MKKILIASGMHTLLQQEQSFLDRSDLRVFISATTDDALAVHRSEHVDLILTRQDLPGMPSSSFCRTIREDAALRTVSIIMACADTAETVRKASRCGVNCVLLDPLQAVVAQAKAEQLLNIAARETLRVLLTADLQGSDETAPFYCRTGNVSASGLRSRPGSGSLPTRGSPASSPCPTAA